MRVVRGREPSIAADRAVSDQLLGIAADGESAVRVWTPHRQVAFGRRDARLEGYDRAREIARDGGFTPVERDVGGRAVAYDGETTLAFARADPVADIRRGTDERYERLTAAVERALLDCGLEIERGEPADSFCPGTHSLSVAESAAGTAPGSRQKVVGIAQRVRQDAALTAGIVLVDGRDALADILEGIYGSLGVAFDPASVGTVGAAGGPADPAVVRRVLEAAIVADAEPTVERIGDSEAAQRRASDTSSEPPSD
ncbi:lipoate--protein ligase family protein [Salinadaptatus halalkaliphilus]|uniref:Lipoate--protein ligase family protein n=1 Tax=Salinadaptatus halalkaliphilus TaxID=2419781 RepID=A0A4S3TQ18_9EURY|nr:lipoate--protein ligase family protein [Salinadaptatus halalkaliphilus]THE66441.1 lipoate--protein ligase family protein [Salinadaptatus halalkaliphilus]